MTMTMRTGPGIEDLPWEAPGFPNRGAREERRVARMGYYCVYVQIRERTLMDLDECEVSSLFRRASAPANRWAPSVLEQYESPTMLDRLPPPMSLEKMWLALHHLLTGEFRAVASPLSRAILGGKEIGEDVGDGPARYLWADEVREISSALWR